MGARDARARDLTGGPAQETGDLADGVESIEHRAPGHQAGDRRQDHVAQTGVAEGPQPGHDLSWRPHSNGPSSKTSVGTAAMASSNCIRV